LREYEVVIPPRELGAREPGAGQGAADEQLAPAPVAGDGTQTQASAAAMSSPGVYLLQVGAFRSLAQADRLKAKLGLLGFEAAIQAVEINANQTWYRVRIGPYRDRAELSEYRDRLREGGYQPLAIRVEER
jgi:cell division protein FtsN